MWLEVRSVSASLYWVTRSAGDRTDISAELVCVHMLGNIMWFLSLEMIAGCKVKVPQSTEEKGTVKWDFQVKNVIYFYQAMESDLAESQ